MRPRVKICGVRRLQDALLAAELGASAVGFVFWPGSPRFIDPYRARTIAAALPPWVAAIGVFVDQSPAHVAGVANLVKLGGVQLHGSERVEEFVGQHHRLIKAVAVTDSFTTNDIDGLPRHVTLLLDAHDPIKRGGTGRTINWSVAATVARLRPIILSGGMTSANIRAAVDHVQPACVDVSSGVESAPGEKDAARMRALFAALAP